MVQDNFKRNRLLIVFSNPWHKLNLWSLTQTPRGRFIHCTAEIARESWKIQKKKNPCWKSENDSSRPGDTYSWHFLRHIIRTFVLLVCVLTGKRMICHIILCIFNFWAAKNYPFLALLPKHPSASPQKRFSFIRQVPSFCADMILVEKIAGIGRVKRIVRPMY